jgi:hypothetical protein
MIYNCDLRDEYQQILYDFPYLTEENFLRILILFYGINYNQQISFPNLSTRIEVTFFSQQISNIPFLVFLKPNSPFTLIDSGTNNHKVMLYKNKYLAEVNDFEQTNINLKLTEPFYFFVREINNDIVLKLNPIQCCYFYRNNNNQPCNFCFRNDFISRYHNISSKKLLELIYQKESASKFQKFKKINEVTIITGTYDSENNFLQEMEILIKGIKKIVPKNCRITIGSHEIRSKDMLLKLKYSGASDCTIPVETFIDSVRKKEMKNNKGLLSSESILTNIKETIDVFGEDHVIVRLIAGLGNPINQTFINKIQLINQMGKSKNGPLWNINIFIPFTHNQFNQTKNYSKSNLNYLFSFCSIINQYIISSRLIKFKISP